MKWWTLIFPGSKRASGSRAKRENGMARKKGVGTRPRTRRRPSVERSRNVLNTIRLFATDVDGVLTDAGMYYSESGDEWKKFNTRDGHGITLLHGAGIKTALVTREKTNIVERR